MNGSHLGPLENRWGGKKKHKCDPVLPPGGVKTEWEGRRKKKGLKKKRVENGVCGLIILRA